MRDAVHLIDYIFAGGTICECGSYNSANYDDPGIPDTLWIEGGTLLVGVEAEIDIGIVNDEPIRGFSLALEWDGSAEMDFYENWGSESVTDRVYDLEVMDYICDFVDGINPDTLYMFTFQVWPDVYMQPGSGAIFHARFTPLSTGTITFRLVEHPVGPESMLVPESESAIIPTLVGGQITVVEYVCGDANSDVGVNVGDAVYLINYIFKQGPAPSPICSGDANGDDDTNVGDAVYLINYVFNDGPPPVEDCCP
jgi:hypothetical protein